MYSDIYEAVLPGSDTVLLVMHERDYFQTYEDLTEENCEDLVVNYFRFTGRDGVPKVSNIDMNHNTGRIQITVDVDYDRDHKLEPMKTPDVLNRVE